MTLHLTFDTEQSMYLGKVFLARGTFSAKGLRQKCTHLARGTAKRPGWLVQNGRNVVGDEATAMTGGCVQGCEGQCQDLGSYSGSIGEPLQDFLVED